MAFKEAHYRGFAAVSDYNLYFYQGAVTLARKDRINFEEQSKRMEIDRFNRILISLSGEEKGIKDLFIAI